MPTTNAQRRKRNWALIAAVLLIMLVGTLSGSPERQQTAYFDLPVPLVIAHQGGNLLRPGDTLLAFDHAVALGVDVLEMDVHLSRDGHLVVIHDRTVDRTTDGQGAVVDLDLAQLQALDAGYHWPFHGEARPYRKRGVVIPTFDEVLARYPGQRLVVELKTPELVLANALCVALQSSSQGQHQALTVVASFHQAALDEFRRLCPAVATSASGDEVGLFLLVQRMSFPQLFTAPALALQMPMVRDEREIMNADIIKDAKSVGLHVDFWTLNEIDEMRRAISVGAHGIMTDRPDLLLDELGRI